MVRPIFGNVYITHFIIFFMANLLVYPFFKNKTFLDMFIISILYAAIWWLWDNASSKKKKHES